MNWPCLLTAAKMTFIALAAITAAGSIGVGFAYLVTHDRIKLAITLISVILTVALMTLFYFVCTGRIQ